MTTSHFFLEQTNRLKPTQTTLPTMYDLPSEDPEELGLPDEFHNLQPQLLSATLRLTDVSSNRIFTGSDLNLYYDAQHPQWYKRPDWFLAVGVPRLYKEQDLRLSYVVWDEGVNPAVVVELLSPGTEKEDLGQTGSGAGEPPPKWQVYERILKVPYYVLYDRYSDTLSGYRLVEDCYQPLELAEGRLWLPELRTGLSLWQGDYQGINRRWLRWVDAAGNWIPTQLEQAEAKAARLAERLRSLGIDPDQD
jgi:Uma2 family endonuclease